MEQTVDKPHSRNRILIKKRVIHKIEPCLYLSPCLIIFLIFIYFPFVKTIYLNLFNTNAQGEASSFEAVSNYVNLFKSGSFIICKQ